MMINDVTAQVRGHKKRKRVGRGESSGWGKTSTRGHKGSQSRSGGLVRPLTEGGQMPIFRRLPKRGFSNVQFRREFQVINLRDLEARFNDGDTVDVAGLRKASLIGSVNQPVKLLGAGELKKKLTVAVHAFSGAARQAVEQAGGSVQQLELIDRAAKAREKRNSQKKQKRAKTPQPAKAVAAAPEPAPETPPAATAEPPAAEDTEKPEI
jgi:large subunit ribosomal protein L15